MSIGSALSRFKNLVINPKSEWELIDSETDKRPQIFRSFVLPLIIMIACGSILGDYIFASRIGFSAGFVIIKAIGIFLISWAGTYLSSIIINELTSSFNSSKNHDTTFKLVAYSLSAYYIIEAFVLLLPSLNVLWVFEAFSIYLFWLGAGVLVKTPDDNKAGFVVVSGLITLGIFVILNRILEQILLGIFGVSVLL